MLIFISGYEDFNSSDGESKPKRKKPRKLSSKEHLINIRRFFLSIYFFLITTTTGF